MFPLAVGAQTPKHLQTFITLLFTSSYHQVKCEFELWSMSALSHLNHWINSKASNVNSELTYLSNNKFWAIKDSHHFHLQFTWIPHIFGQATLPNIPLLASTVTDPGVVSNYTIGAWQILHWSIQFGSRNVACHETIWLNYMAKLMWHTNKSQLNMRSVGVWTCLGTTVLSVKISPKLNTSSWLVDFVLMKSFRVRHVHS